MKTHFTAAALALLVLGGTVAPAAAEWSLLGIRNVRDRTENDVIVVEGAKTFQRIRLCVYRNPVQFKNVNVVFRNGGRQDVVMADRIGPGACTRAIDLAGGARDIQRIEFRYEEAGRGRHTATVRAFGE
jgi:hypothetical protein